MDTLDRLYHGHPVHYRTSRGPATQRSQGAGTDLQSPSPDG